MSTLLHERSKVFYPVFERKDGDPTVTHYCPGCGHGLVHKYVAEAVEDLGVADRTIFVNPVGCSVFAYYYLDLGHIQAAHGRAPAVGTAVKRARPDSVVIVYQGDGDLAAIGGNEILHAANRGEGLTVLFINNAIYGMTGGQMAPTTLLGQVTTTTPAGRDAAREGFPLRMCELLSTLEAPVFIERVALGDAKHDLAARKAIRRALRNQIEGRGFSFVEVLSPCPTGWGVTPPEAARFVLDAMTQTFPLGVVRDAEGVRAPARRAEVLRESVPEILGLREAGSRAEAAAGPAGGSSGSAAPRLLDARIKAAGFGGQGVLFLGSLIAEAGRIAGYGVSWLPSYGPEMRGGTAHCHVILARGEVDSPLVTRATLLFAFNRPSLERFAPEVEDGGLVIYDASMVSDPPPMARVRAIAVPATEIAERLGSKRAANMVALGAYLAVTGSLPRAAVEAALRASDLDPRTVDFDLRALEEGMRVANGSLAEREP